MDGAAHQTEQGLRQRRVRNAALATVPLLSPDRRRSVPEFDPHAFKR